MSAPDRQPRPPAPADAATGLPETGWRLRLRVEPLAWGIVLLIAALTRLPVLGALPLGLSDSTRALAAWQVAQGRVPSAWSGDLAETLTAAVFKLFGAGDGAARLAPALLGVALVAALWLLRPAAGRVPSLLAALFIALSPACVAVSRSFSAYSAGALFAVVAAAMLFEFIERLRPAPLAALVAVLGLGLSTDAAFLVFLLLAALFCIVEAFWKNEAAPRAAGVYLREHRQLIGSLLLILAAGLLLATTRFGIAPQRLRSAALLSWSDAFRPVAGGPPWSFPLLSLLAYEPLLLVAGGAEALLLWLVSAERSTCPFERFLLYWLAGALCFALLAPNREPGQLPMLLVPLALLAGNACGRWLESATASDLRAALPPALLAFPAFVYVLFVLEASTFQLGLSFTQVLALVLLFLGGISLLALGAIWAQRSAPAFLTLCGISIGLVFGLHSLTHTGWRAGDEFLLGAVATPAAPALGQEIDRITPSLRGPVSLAPALAEPLAWYTRSNLAVHVEPPNRASGAIVAAVDQAVPAGFETLIAGNQVRRAWYPDSVDLEGIVRWLLYRQAWDRVEGTSAHLLIKGK